MKKIFRGIIFLAMHLLLVACGQSDTTPSFSTLSPIAMATSSVIPKVSMLSTLNAIPTQTQAYIPPTLLPTIEPGPIPGLLRNAFSIQTVETVNGYKIRQITGWDYGLRQFYRCGSYKWLDSNHMLFYPRIGQAINNFLGTREDLAPQPTVINLETGAVWLPHTDETTWAGKCNSIYWSQNLGLLITSGITISPHGTYENRDAVFTYTFDGEDVAYYWGKLLDVSPSGTKILVADDTIIDLRNDKIIELDWYMNYDYERSSKIYWTSDETRIYRCCYYYADLTTDESYSFELSELRRPDGKPAPSSMLPHAWGRWIYNDASFLVEWSWVDDGDIRYIPMFDPAKKVFYDVREMAGISGDLSCPETDVSPDGKFLWIMCYETDYLVDLSNFETTTYPGYSQVDINWSKDSQFGWLTDFDTSDNKTEILSISDKKLSRLPITPLPESEHWWHPIDNIVVYPAKDRNSLIFLDVSTMSFRELPSTLQEPINNDNLAWSPNGEKIALVAEDGSIWQVDFPTLGNLEQLTLPWPLVRDLNWSPDGNSLSFVSGHNIYLVDAAK